jgi:hypothetical protein
MVTTLKRLGEETMYLNIIQAISDKSTADITFYEKLKAFPLRTG